MKRMLYKVASHMKIITHDRRIISGDFPTHPPLQREVVHKLVVHLYGYALLPVIGRQWYTFGLGRQKSLVDTVGVSCFIVHLCGYALLPVIGGQWYTFDLGRQKLIQWEYHVFVHLR